MLCVNFHSMAVYNSAVMEFWPLSLEQRIKLFLNLCFYFNFCHILLRSMSSLYAFSQCGHQEELTHKVKEILTLTQDQTESSLISKKTYLIHKCKHFDNPLQGLADLSISCPVQNL